VCTRRAGNKLYRLPSNYEEVMRRVALVLNQTIAFVDMASMSIGEQIRLVSQATLLTSSAGGGSFIGLFLPKGASMILFSDKTHDRQLDFGFFSALSHVEVTYILTERRQPVGLKDMLHTVDRMLASAGVFGNGSVRVVLRPQGNIATTATTAVTAITASTTAHIDATANQMNAPVGDAPPSQIVDRDVVVVDPTFEKEGLRGAGADRPPTEGAKNQEASPQ
jgi:hypothetical protein